MRLSHLSPLQSVLWLAYAAGAGATPFAYIANTDSGSISVIDLATNQVSDTIGVGRKPYALAVNRSAMRRQLSERLGNRYRRDDEHGDRQHPRGVRRALPCGEPVRHARLRFQRDREYRVGYRRRYQFRR